MGERLYYLFGGPVLRRELQRMAGGRGPQVLLFVYATFLFLQSFWHMTSIASARARVREEFNQSVALRNFFRGRAHAPVGLTYEQRWALNHLEYRCVLGKTADYVSTLLYQQLALMVIVVPLLTAGAVVYEKEKDTLQALFGTELTGAEIVAGKVLGRLAGIARIAGAAVPPLVFTAAVAEVPLARVFLAFVQAAVLAFALASACVLLSLWTRRVNDAVIGSYSTLVVGYVVVQFVLSKVALPVGFLDPLEILSRLLSAGQPVRALQLLVHCLGWGVFGLACCALTAVRLRPVSIASAEDRPPRWWWAFRPGIGDDPVRWRERHCLGIAPLPILRFIPRWMGRLTVLAVSAAMAGDALVTALSRNFFERLWALDFATVRAILASPRLTYLWWDIHLMGGLLLVVGCLTVGVRCASSILEEKRRKTWEDLILTPLTMDEILRGKYWGILQAAVIPVVLYALPMLVLSTVGGWDGVTAVMVWLGIVCASLPIAGTFGLEFARGESADEAPRHDPRMPRPFSLGGNVLD